MNKKLYTILFVLISTAANLISLILLIGILVALCYLSLHFIFNIQPPHNAYGMSLFICLIAGIILHFIFYTKISTKLIEKFHIDKNFEDKWLPKFSGKKSSSEEKPKRKTNMPSSVSLSEKEKADRERWGNN